MRAFVIVSLLAVLVAAAYANAIPQDEAEGIERRGAKEWFQELGNKIKKAFEDLGKKIKSVFHKDVKKVEAYGKKIGQFASRVGDFFVKEGKEASHTIVVAGKAVEHIGEDVYTEAKKIFEEIVHSALFHEVVLKLVDYIDSDKGQTACADLAEKAIDEVAGKDASKAVKSADPLFKSVCKGALHVADMFAHKELDNNN